MYDDRRSEGFADGLVEEPSEEAFEGKAAAALALIEEDGKVLLAAANSPELGVWWQLPGGIVTTDDPLPEALRRHLSRHAGLETVIDDLLYVTEIDDYLIFTFGARLAGPETLIGPKLDCVFVPIEQLDGFPRLMGREPLVEWLRQRERSRRYFRLGQPLLTL